MKGKIVILAAIALGSGWLQASEQYYAHYTRDDDADTWIGGSPTLVTTPVFERPWDYDDQDSNIHPGAYEIPANGIDDDCDGVVDGTYAGGLAFEDIASRIVLVGRSLNVPLNISAINNDKAVWLQSFPSGAHLTGWNVTWTPESGDTNREFLFTVATAGGGDVIQRQFTVTVWPSTGGPMLSTNAAWTWIKGTNTGNQPGIYGTQGESDPANTPGGRYDALSWMDSTGALWLFGGWGYDAVSQGSLNDLWKFDPAITSWTWMKGSTGHNQAGTYGTRGVPDPANTPGARFSAVTWTNDSGVWLFGGWGYDASGGGGTLNDLWKFDPATLNWTWIKGSNVVDEAGIYGTRGVAAPANNPGARYNSVAWTDGTGALWLFGGYGYDVAGDSDYLNDLWKFDPATTNWTWMKGSMYIGQTGIYGTRGVPSAGNTPGARESGVSWKDSSGKLWLFGGGGYDAVDWGQLNDVWKFDPATTNWTWIKGFNTVDHSGTYGTRGMPDPANTPGGRSSSASWMDGTGAFWLCGGDGYDAFGGSAYLNDLWKFDPATTNWTWMSGTNVINQYGIYGTQGVTDPDNMPGTRYGAVSWTDGAGTLWFFGGQGYDGAGGGGDLNDLWTYGVSGGIALDAHALGFSATYQGANPAEQMIGMSNVGATAFTYTNVITYGAGATGWLTVLPAADTVAPGSATILTNQVNIAGLGAGTYYATNLIIAADATNSPELVVVTLTIGKASQTITLRNPGTQYITNTVHLQAEASSGLPVTNFTVGYGPGEISGLTNLTFTDTGMVCIIAGQAGDANWNPAPSVSNRFKVTAYIYPALSTNACWTWMKGANVVGQTGIYGTQGVPDPANTPGVRLDAVSWTDDMGALWLFGGWGYAVGSQGSLNDLWKYDPATTNWTWIKGTNVADRPGIYGVQGVPDPANTPGTRYSEVLWTDSMGALWIFGGWGCGASAGLGYLSDLWKYDPATTNWTWIKGATNINQNGIYGIQGVPDPANNPGARYGAIAWTDDTGALWLFGGYGRDVFGNDHALNDLWKYDPATANWTWIKGTNIVDQAGIYGTQGVPDPANTPGARYNAVAWTDGKGALWLFSGEGYVAPGVIGCLTDVWKLDLATTNWTWIKGANIVDQNGIYGTQGVPDPANTPGARNSAVSWKDGTGAFWLFSGFGYDASGGKGYLNDLWKYDPATTNWTWMKGATIMNQNGTYGTQGVPSPANVPGARYGTVSWMDDTGALWCLGGVGLDGVGSEGVLNDLWKFDASSGGISLDTNALAFSATYQGANPTEQMIVMTNVGGRAFSYTNVIAYGAGASGWLTVLPVANTVAPGSATILTNQVNIAGLGAGTYYATNQIVAADATNSPQIVVVTLTVSKADQAITNFPNPGPQFTTNTVQLFAQASSGLAVTNFTVSGPGVISGLTNLTFTNFGVVSVKADQAGDANWNAAPTVTNTFTVTRATATVNLTDLSQTYNGTARPVTSSTTPAGLPLTITYDGNAWAPTNAGSYTVTGIVESSHAMYQGTSVVTLTVGKASQTITFNNPGPQLTTNMVGLAMSSDSGLAVTGSVVAGSAYASIANGTNLTFTGYGDVTIRASQTGDVNYTSATPVDQTFTITRATAAVNLTGLSQTYNGTARPVTTSTVPVGLPLTITYNGNTWAPTNAGSYAVTGMVESSHAMYQGTSVVTLTVSAATLTVTPKAVATNYNGVALDNTVYSTNTANYDITGFSNSETVVSAGVTLSGSMAFNGSTATVVRAVGTYTQAIGALAMSCTANNYSMNFANPATNNYFITAAALTITANNDSKTYGQTKSYGAGLTNFASVGLQGTDTVGTVTITAGGGTESNAAVGAYALIPSDATAGTFNTNNYAITYSNGTLQVGAAALTITATATNKVYGDADPTLAYTITSGQLVGADSITGAMTRVAGESVGDYPIQQGSLGAGANYAITFVPANLTIAALPVVLNGVRAYDGTTAADYAILSVSNKVGSDNVLPVSGSATLMSANAGVRAFSSLGTLVLGGTQSSNYTLIGAGGSVTITQATATVTLNNLSQTYDGTARLVTATTVPGGLAVLITYDGGAAAPVNAGSYAVVGTIADGNYQGVANGTLVVAKANQTITFPTIPDQVVTSQLVLAATASSGLPVTFVVVSGPAQILTGNVLTFTGVGMVTVAAAQLGDANWNAAAPVANTFNVIQAIAPIVGIPNADFDGDGLADPATYDENTGNWKIMMSTSGYATMSLPNLLGGPGWVAAVGDYDGDGLADPAVFQDTTGDWILMKSDSGYAQLHVYALMGAPGWAPDSANFTGDRVWEFTVYQEATGNWTFKLGGMVGALDIYKYNLIGGPGYSPVSADFDGDGYADPTVYNRTDGTWKLLLSGSGYFPLTLPHFLGGMGWSAVPADYDGDGLADPAVRKDDGSIWRIMLSRIGYFTIDVPLGL